MSVKETACDQAVHNQRFGYNNGPQSGGQSSYIVLRRGAERLPFGHSTHLESTRMLSFIHLLLNSDTIISYSPELLGIL